MIQSHVFKALRWLPQRGTPQAHQGTRPTNTPASAEQPAVPAASRTPRVVMLEPARPRLSIHRHPDDLRRTVISGRFAEVCAALEGLAAAEPEAA